MSKLLRTTIFAALCLAFAGCGAKGALILPEKAAPIETPAETGAEVPAPAVDTVTTPADQQAEDAVEDPELPVEND